MTEHEWLTGNDLRRMFEFVAWKASDRKVLLFGVACCRRIGHLFTDERHWPAIEVVEQFAEGKATVAELEEAERWAESRFHAAYLEIVGQDCGYCDPRVEPYRAGWCLTGCSPRREKPPYRMGAAVESAWAAASICNWADLPPGRRPFHEATPAPASVAAQAALLRDVFVNPFRPVAPEPFWFSASAVAIAREIYDERRYWNLHILADALEEAGCTSAELLDHCRSGGEHVRGCFVLDLVLDQH